MFNHEWGTVDKEKRKGEKPVPDNLEDLVNEVQLLTLHQIERFGWRLMFVRRPLFQDVIPVVVSGEGDKIGVLDEDGRLDMQSPIKIRE